MNLHTLWTLYFLISLIKGTNTDVAQCVPTEQHFRFMLSLIVFLKAYITGNIEGHLCLLSSSLFFLLCPRLCCGLYSSLLFSLCFCLLRFFSSCLRCCLFSSLPFSRFSRLLSCFRLRFSLCSRFFYFSLLASITYDEFVITAQYLFKRKSTTFNAGKYFL